MSQQKSEITATRRDILRASAGHRRIGHGGHLHHRHAFTPPAMTLHQDRPDRMRWSRHRQLPAGQALSTDGPVQLVAVADAFEDQAHNAVENASKQSFPTSRTA